MKRVAAIVIWAILMFGSAVTGWWVIIAWGGVHTILSISWFVCFASLAVYWYRRNIGGWMG